MIKNMEYKEPEFKVVMTNTADVITTSGDSGSLAAISAAWDTGFSGEGVGDITFGL